MMMSEFVFRSEQTMNSSTDTTTTTAPPMETATTEPSSPEKEPKTDNAGAQCWYDDNGQLHREDGPAKISIHGQKEWWIHGKRHRENDLPAIVSADGSTEWWENNLHHRIGNPAKITLGGDKVWKLNGQLHREDGPAIEYADKERGVKYYQKGARHRLDGPAVISANGNEWWVEGKKMTEEEFKALVLKRNQGSAPGSKHIIDSDGNELWYDDQRRLHREDGPAGVYTASKHLGAFREWKIHGKLHRTDGPAIEYDCGNKLWYQDGLLHRVGGPAVEDPGGYKSYWFHGRLHREDGPAVIGSKDSDGTLKVEYYLFGKQLSFTEFQTRMRMPATSSSTSPELQTQLSWMSGWMGSEDYQDLMDAEVWSSESEEDDKGSTDKTSSKPEKKKAKNWPDDLDMLLNYEEVYAPLKDVLEKGYTLSRRPATWDFEYGGYDLGKLEKKDFPSLNTQFSEKYLKAQKEKTSTTYPQGISLCDLVMRAMFQMGIEQGRRMSYQDLSSVKELNKLVEKYRDLVKDLRYQLAKTTATLKIKELHKDKDEATINQLIDQELEDTRKSRLEEIKKDLKLNHSSSPMKGRKAKKARLGELVGVASTLDPQIVKLQDWVAILKDYGCSFQEWKKFCGKKHFTKFID